MGRFLPVIILLFLLAIGGYAAYESYSFLKNRPGINLPQINIPLPQFLKPSTSNASPTPTPAPSPIPSSAPTSQVNQYLSVNLLPKTSTCVHEVLESKPPIVYIWAICTNSTMSLSTPVVITLDSSASGVLFHQKPRAGDNYEPDLKNLFPESVRNHKIFTDPSLLDRLQSELK